MSPWPHICIHSDKMSLTISLMSPWPHIFHKFQLSSFLIFKSNKCRLISVELVPPLSPCSRAVGPEDISISGLDEQDSGLVVLRPVVERGQGRTVVVGGVH